MADFTGAMDEGWLEESHYKMSKKIAQLTRVLARVRTRRCLQRRCCAPPAACAELRVRILLTRVYLQVIGMLVNKNEEQEYEKQYLSEAFEVELGRVVDEANELLNEARAGRARWGENGQHRNAARDGQAARGRKEERLP